MAHLRLLTRYGYFPAMFLGINGLAAAIVFSGLSPSLAAASLVALMAVALTLAFGAERLIPYDPEWNSSRGDVGRDIAHFIVNESTSLGPLLVIPIFAVTAPAPPSPLWPSAWPLLVQGLFAVAVFDLSQTLFHWASHRWKPLWRLHAVHHSVERMYALNGILKHPVYQVVSAVVSLAPLVLLGMPKAFSLVIAFSTFVQLLLQHSNVDYRTGPGKWVFAVAEVHRFHHLRGVAGDVNFALFFSLWDNLLGNGYYAARRLGTHDIGLDVDDYPRDYAGQLAAPFREFTPRGLASVRETS